MGSAAENTEPTTGTEKYQFVELEEEDEQVVDLRRKTSSFPHGKGLDSVDTSTVTTINTSLSSSFSGDGKEGTSDFRNGEGEHAAIENLEVREQETEGNNCNVYFDGEQGSELASAGPDTHESQTADSLNGEKKQSESANGSTFEDIKQSREIEEVQEDGDFPKDLDDVDQVTGDVIEEELEIGNVEDYDVEKVLENQETHDLYCPNCNSCITKRVVLKRRKRKFHHVLEDPKRLRGTQQSDPSLHSEDNLPSGENSRRESFVFKCLSCFNIFIPTGVDSKPVPPSEGFEGLKTQPKPQEEATGDSNWFRSIFTVKRKTTTVPQGGAMPSVPRDNSDFLGEDTTGFTANTPSEAPALVQDGAATSIQVANSHDTSKDVNNGAIVEHLQNSLALVAKHTQQRIHKDNANAADVNRSSEKEHLSLIQPSRDMNISNIVTSGPDGVRVETIIQTEGVSHLFEGTDTKKPDFGLIKVTDEREVITASHEVDIPPESLLEEGTLREPFLRPVREQIVRPEILKSIVYGGLIESITSLGVISSAAGSGATTLNILVLGIANLFSGLILLIHKLQELREEEPIRTTTEDNQTNSQEGRYERFLGRRENFTLHASVAILSFIIVGLLPPVVYYFSFSKTHNKDYKVVSVFGASLLCIVMLAIAKAHVRSPRGSHLKSVMYYSTVAVSVSGVSYVVGNFVDLLLEKYGWSDGSETPSGKIIVSLMGRKAGSF